MRTPPLLHPVRSLHSNLFFLADRKSNLLGIADPNRYTNYSWNPPKQESISSRVVSTTQDRSTNSRVVSSSNRALISKTLFPVKANPRLFCAGSEREPTGQSYLSSSSTEFIPGSRTGGERPEVLIDTPSREYSHSTRILKGFDDSRISANGCAQRQREERMARQEEEEDVSDVSTDKNSFRKKLSCCS